MTLSETAQLTKKVMIYAAIALMIIFALWGGIAYYLATRPVEVYVELPTKGFGLIPKPVLPKSLMTASSVNYNLDTETGALPTGLPELIKVYAIQKLGVTFASPERAKRIARGFLFNNGPEIQSPTRYRFTDDNGGEMLYALDTGNFRFKRPLVPKTEEFTDQEIIPIESENQIASNFKKYLGDQGILQAQLADGRTRAFYNRAQVQEASEAAVTVWQADITEGQETTKVSYPIVTPTFKEGLVKGTVTRYQANQNKYLSIDYIFWPIDTAESETYPIKTVEEAFEQLKNGEGVTVLPYSKSNVAIENVYLAYYLPIEYVPYLQPVYVFQGPEFAAYVPAITSDNFVP